MQSPAPVLLAKMENSNCKSAEKDLGVQVDAKRDVSQHSAFKTDGIPVCVRRGVAKRPKKVMFSLTQPRRRHLWSAVS